MYDEKKLVDSFLTQYKETAMVEEYLAELGPRGRAMALAGLLGVSSLGLMGCPNPNNVEEEQQVDITITCNDKFTLTINDNSKGIGKSFDFSDIPATGNSVKITYDGYDYSSDNITFENGTYTLEFTEDKKCILTNTTTNNTIVIGGKIIIIDGE